VRSVSVGVPASRGDPVPVAEVIRGPARAPGSASGPRRRGGRVGGPRRVLPGVEGSSAGGPDIGVGARPAGVVRPRWRSGQRYAPARLCRRGQSAGTCEAHDEFADALPPAEPTSRDHRPVSVRGLYTTLIRPAATRSNSSSPHDTDSQSLKLFLGAVWHFRLSYILPSVRWRGGVVAPCTQAPTSRGVRGKVSVVVLGDALTIAIRGPDTRRVHRVRFGAALAVRCVATSCEELLAVFSTVSMTDPVG